MSVLRRLNLYSGMRLDIPHLRMLESSITADFDAILRKFLTGSKPYIIKGFDINIPQNSIPAANLKIKVAGSVILHSTATEPGTIYYVPDDIEDDYLTVNNPNILGYFQNDTLNYIGLDLIRETDVSTSDETIGWSETQQSTYYKTVPLGLNLKYRYVINTTGFTTQLPLYIVKLSNTGTVEYIVNAKTSFFRLGTGGNIPNPFNEWNFLQHANEFRDSFKELEQHYISEEGLNPLTTKPTNNADIFLYGDFSINSFKDWMDAIMTRIKHMSGSDYWYANSNIKDLSDRNIWYDSVGSVFTSNGNIIYNLVMKYTIEQTGMYGRVQTKLTDSTLLDGQSYIVGSQSLTRALLNIHLSDIYTLLIYSPSSLNFTVSPTPELIYNRRKWLFNSNLYKLIAHNENANRIAVLRNIQSGSINYDINNISISQNTLFITLDNSSALDISAGAYIKLENVSDNNSLDLSYTYLVKGVTKDSNDNKILEIDSVVDISGPIASGGKVYILDNTSTKIHPYIPKWNISTANYNNPQNIPGQATITLTVPENHTLTDGDEIIVTGIKLTLDNSTTQDIGGRYLINLINSNNEIEILVNVNDNINNIIVNPSAQIILSKAQFILSVSKSSPTDYSVDDVMAEAVDFFSIKYIIGSSTLPPTPDASGNIEFDGVVAILKLDPVNGSAVQPGPLSWTEDIIIQSINNNRRYIIPKTAISDNDTANQFNINNFNGFIYLENNQVAYIKLIRDQIASSANTYICNNGVFSGVIPTGNSAIDDNSPLRVGDFIKFRGESDRYWYYISDNINPIGTAISTNQFYVKNIDNSLIDNNNGRPNNSGVLLYSRGYYPIIHVADINKVPLSGDIYWIAARVDNNSQTSKVYFRGLELEEGEIQRISDNEPSNLLIYTGAFSEAAINPNYSISDSNGIYKFSQELTIQSIEPYTRLITFTEEPDFGFQLNDKFTIEVSNVLYTFHISQVLTSRTVIVKEDINSILNPNDTVTYFAQNYSIEDNNNLTLGMRKLDRTDAKFHTSLNRQIYDESIYPQLIQIDSNSDIIAGQFIYTGLKNNPSFFAWVLHGSIMGTRSIEGANITMPGGMFNDGTNKYILAHIYINSTPFPTSVKTFDNDTTIIIPNSTTISPVIPGDENNGIQMVLPPNRRTQIIGSEYVVYPAPAVYKTSTKEYLQGEELLVIANDSIREVNIDYKEIFGGPHGIIQWVRTLPENSRIRFRILPSYGSPILSLASNITLQSAYNGGNIIGTTAGLPVKITNNDTSKTVLELKGSVAINGINSTGAVDGGIYGTADNSFNLGKDDKRVLHAWLSKLHVRSHTGLNGTWSYITDTILTSDNLGNEFSNIKIYLNPNQVVRINASIVAKDENSVPMSSAAFKLSGIFYRDNTTINSSGYPEIIYLGGTGNGSYYAVSFQINTTNNYISIIVYGYSGTNVLWASAVDYQII